MTTAPSHRAPGPPTAGHRRPPVDPVLLDRLDGQVRDVVRREGIDPQRDGRLVRRIVEDVVRAHDDLSLTGQVVPLGDPVAVVGELVARVAGFGALQVYLDDPEIAEVWINDPCWVC